MAELKRMLTKKIFLPLLVWCSLVTPCFASESAASQAKQRPLERLEPHFRESVLRGWRSFQTSFARDGASCFDCHPTYEKMRHWAPSYPKAVVFDGTPYRVKGLPEVVAEALAIHTDLAPEKRTKLVADLVAFIAWWGDGKVFRPGQHHQAPPAGGLTLLNQAQRRGQTLFENKLGYRECHVQGSAGELRTSAVAAHFPRFIPESGGVLSLISFLQHHLLQTRGSTVDLRQCTDLAAYLAAHAEGVIYHPGMGTGKKEAGK